MGKMAGKVHIYEQQKNKWKSCVLIIVYTVNPDSGHISDLFEIPQYCNTPSPPCEPSFASSCTLTCSCPSLCGGTPRCRIFWRGTPCTPWTSPCGQASGSSRCHRQSWAHQRRSMQQGHLVRELLRTSWKQRGCCFSVCQKPFWQTFLHSTREWHHIRFQNTRWGASRCSAPLLGTMDAGQLGCSRDIGERSKSQVCCRFWRSPLQFFLAQWCSAQSTHS